MSGNVQRMFLALYAVVKDALRIQPLKEAKRISTISKSIAILFTIAMIIAVGIVLVPFLLFRICLDLYLKIKYGQLYGGIMRGEDVFFEVSSEHVVFNLVVILSTDENPSVLYESVCKSALNNLYNTSYKLRCSIGKLFGYCYLVKDQVKFDDVIVSKKYNNDEFMTRQMLFDYFENECGVIEENHMMRVVFFSQPIRWNENNTGSKKQYALLGTFRHALGDGPSIAGLMRKFLLIEANNSVKVKLDPQITKPALNLDNVSVFSNPLTRKLDESLLESQNKGQWYIASFLEESVKYVPVIKKIKKELNIGFSEALGAAICASISDYMMQRKAVMDKFTMTPIIRAMDTELLEIINGTYNFENIYNNFALVAVPVPVKKRTMKETMLYFRQCGQEMKHAMDYIIFYGMLHGVFTCLPIPIIDFLRRKFMSGITVVISNMIGFPKSTCCGANIEDMFFFVPKLFDIGYTFTILSYEDKFQISVTSRPGYATSREHLQTILDNVLKKIDEAAEEIF